MSSAAFREYLFPPGHPRIQDLKGLAPYAYREVAQAEGTFTGGLIRGWRPLYKNDFRGITEDGSLREGIHPLEPAEPGEEAPVADTVTAARELLDTLDTESRERIRYAVDAVEWQTWANPEFIQFDTGLRLELQPPQVRRAALALVRKSLSAQGYEEVRTMMRINGFLGEVVGLENILGEFSYNFALYGTPDETAPWGWQLFGHHCAVNCLVVEGRSAIGPVFLGAEPNRIDAGPHAGPPAFTERITLGRQVMTALTPELRSAATVYERMVDPGMPEDRVHPGDERHLAGAFQDNRVIPFEGVCVRDMPPAARELVAGIVEEFHKLLPAGPRAARMREVRAHLDETWFCWIGGHGPDDVFYYRVQSPVVLAELDHHCGVFLDYDSPEPFHVHTVLRTPHGNDYGRSWVRQWQQGRLQ
ncbi:DUF3500 domain-containing protein [Streptomyces sp. NPDC002795]|uniref:DUF3500 domain-containing protein n=1 Tax=Streptomyces sp. NPDC002795 TaxID=3364665 RepID=UPI0036AE340F